MSDEAHELESVESPTRSEDSWPLVVPERYEVQFTDAYRSQQHGPPDLSGLRLAMTIVGVVGGILLLASIAMIAVGLASGSASSSPWPAVLGAAIAGCTFVIVWFGSLRNLPPRLEDDEPDTLAEYAFAITPTALEFPATAYQSAASWERSSTTASVAGDDWTRRLVLRYPGQRNRYFFAWVMADSPEDLVARISAALSEPSP